MKCLMGPTEGLICFIYLSIFLIVWLTQSCDSKVWLSWALLLVLLTASRQLLDSGDSPRKQLLMWGLHHPWEMLSLLPSQMHLLQNKYNYGVSLRSLKEEKTLQEKFSEPIFEMMLFSSLL